MLNSTNELIGKKVTISDMTLKEQEQVGEMPVDEELEKLDPRIGMNLGIRYFSIRAAQGDIIGACSAYNFFPPKVEVGIRIWDRYCWNKGYGTEAMKLLCEWIFNTGLAEIILLKTPVENIRAYKCYEKVGFVEYSRANVEGYDMVLMSLSKGGQS